MLNAVSKKALVYGGKEVLKELVFFVCDATSARLCRLACKEYARMYINVSAWKRPEVRKCQVLYL